jgi:hypothetical protein
MDVRDFKRLAGIAGAVDEEIANLIFREAEGTAVYDQGDEVLIARGTKNVRIPKSALLGAAEALKKKGK